jgi:hypothetical protein
MLAMREISKSAQYRHRLIGGQSAQERAELTTGIRIGVAFEGDTQLSDGLDQLVRLFPFLLTYCTEQLTKKADIVDERQFFRRNIIHRRRIECTCHKSLKRHCVKTGSSVFQFHGGTDLPANQNWRGLRMQPLRECLGFPRIPVCVFALGSII